jgi:hypothetical protein
VRQDKEAARQDKEAARQDKEVARQDKEAARQDKDALATYGMIEGADSHISLCHALANWSLTLVYCPFIVLALEQMQVLR